MRLLGALAPETRSRFQEENGEEEHRDDGTTGAGDDETMRSVRTLAPVARSRSQKEANSAQSTL